MALSWGKRIRLYLFGLIIGLVVVYFFVMKDKNIYKTPQEVIFERLQHWELQVSEISQCKFNCIQKDSKDLIKIIPGSEIVYGESEVRKEPFPIYKIYTHDASGPIDYFRAEMRDSTFYLIDIGLKTDSCQCR
jgi:hypothetical protein